MSNIPKTKLTYLYLPVMFHETVEMLRKKLSMPLPGAVVQKEMAPVLADPIKFNPSAKQDTILGGVLILLYSVGDRIMLPLIQRPVYNGVHSGQISFPGGKKEKNESLVETALREAHEEIGVPIDEIEIIGTLTELFIPASNFKVLPVVGIISTPFKFSPDKHEVVKILEADIMELLQDPRKTKTIEVKRVNLNILIEAPYFDVKGNVVWGATAMMLSELLYLLNQKD